MNAASNLMNALAPLRNLLWEGDLGLLCHLWERNVYAGLSAAPPPAEFGETLSPRERQLFDLLFRRQAVTTSAVRTLLGAEGLAALENATILESRGGETCSTGLVLRPVLGSFLFFGQVHQGAEEAQAYVHYGPDSRIMAEALLNLSPAGRFLDLCAGSGILAMSLARGGGTGVAVEWSEPVCRVAEVNIALAGLGERLQVKNGDLFGPVTGDRFDVVVSNPPFSPSSLDRNLDPAGAGGLDGLDVVREIWGRMDEFLLPKGKLILLFAALGDGTVLQCKEELDRLGRDVGYRTTVLAIDPPQPVDRLTIPRGFERQKLIRDAAARFSASHYHTVIFTMSRADTPGLTHLATYPPPAEKMAQAVRQQRAARHHSPKGDE